ncbi:MAG: MlaD family protein [Alphaproteobacteria bacterium]|nr:MlaD family protein [Alphaproteobacteria bacterium]
MKHFMSQKKEEILTGTVAFLLLFFGVAFSYTHKKKDAAQGDDFRLYVSFKKADGLMDGAVVRVSGIPVGKVLSQELTDAYRVKMQLSLYHPVKLPIDTIASIETDGLIGEKHVELIPGGEEESLKNGDIVRYEQDVVLLDELIDKFASKLKK